MKYRVPNESFRLDLEVKRSQFITFIRRCNSREAFKDFLDQLKEEFPDARHHCYAFKVGAPNDSQALGFSDDGEPSGTAGKPLLNVLMGKKDLGEVAVIVVRYFGGTKLGTGGLVRAYTDAAQTALEQIKYLEIVPQQNVRIEIPFEFENRVRKALADQNWQITGNHYTDKVEFEISVPQTIKLKDISSLVTNLTSGAGLTLTD